MPLLRSGNPQRWRASRAAWSSQDPKARCERAVPRPFRHERTEWEHRQGRLMPGPFARPLGRDCPAVPLPNPRARPSSASDHDIGALASFGLDRRAPIMRAGISSPHSGTWYFRRPAPVLSVGKPACRHRRPLEPSSEGQRRPQIGSRTWNEPETLPVEPVSVPG